jgi:biopolymer transport protein ExbB
MSSFPEPTFSRRRMARYASILKTIVLAALFLGAGARPAQAWWDSEWPVRKLITVDSSGTGAAISDPIASVPVLIRLHDGDFQFAQAKPDGTDLRFVSEDDKTLLPYHIEKFDTLLDEAFIWVNVPGLKPGGKTSFWLYYGNTGNKAVKVESAKDTYDAETVLVYHFNEKGQPCYDFSGQGNSAQNAGISADGTIIGSGLRLDGHSAVTIPASPSLSWSEGGAMTWSAWIKFGQPQDQAVFFSRRDGANVLLIGADKNSPFVVTTYRGSVARSSAGLPESPGTWHLVSVVASGSRMDLYVDGEAYSSLAAPLPSLNGPLVLGGDGSSAAKGITGFVGEMDELTIARTARSPGFLKFEAVEQGADTGSKAVLVGPDEQPTNWLSFLKKGYIGVIIGSLTIDGWVVIGFLGIMALVSWYVMITKAGYLNRVGKGNDLFIKEWRKMGTHFGAVATKDGGEDPAKKKGRARPGPMRDSPLFHIYNMGLQEIDARLSAEQPAGTLKVRTISARSIEAIRASLDSGLVRESQRLSSQMVLLTIAISGGPFLGLLGTVVGVMITFAAVAQAGDVNVNAIAPGIAAALAATVAGLAVAIPALFGYNYLLTRIKSITSDLNVFIDEFVTKLAEHYENDSD